MKSKLLLVSGFVLFACNFGTATADNSRSVMSNQPLTLAYHGGGHFGGYHGGFHRGYGGYRHVGWRGGWGHRRVGWGGGWGYRPVGYCRFNYCGPRYRVGRYCVNRVKPIYWRGKYGKLHKRYVRKIVCYRRW